MLEAFIAKQATGKIIDADQQLSWSALIDIAKQQPLTEPFWPATNTIDSIIRLTSALLNQQLAVPYNPKFTAAQLARIRQQNDFSRPMPTQLATGIFTSGSTGTPKLAVHELTQHMTHAQRANRLNLTNANSRWHMSLPLFHIGGLAVFFRCLVAGCDLLLHGRVDDANFLRQQKITHASCVATQLQRLASQPLDGLALQTLLVGGGPVPAELLSLPLPLRYTYGMTEASSQVCTQGVDQRMHWLCEHQFSPNGELLLSGQTLFAGYLEHNQLIACPQPFASKDIARYDNGWLTILGRVDNQFISGGENIQPEAIESCLLSCSGVTQAIVVPVPDPLYGQRPFAYIAGAASHTQVQQHCQSELPRFMQPVAYAQLHYCGLKPNRRLLAEQAKEQYHG